jgi:hypothetical protein
VTAFAMTNDDHVWLESGLEHDLLRKCDRHPDVEWLVSQPFRLAWAEPPSDVASNLCRLDRPLMSTQKHERMECAAPLAACDQRGANGHASAHHPRTD